MAARVNPKQDERSRDAIKTTQLVKRLNCFALSEKDEKNQEVKMTRDQIAAARILLGKTLPDLSATELKGEVKTATISDKPLSDEEWEKQYGGSAGVGMASTVRPPKGTH